MIAEVSTDIIKEYTELEFKAEKAIMDLSQEQCEQPRQSNCAKLPKLQLPVFEGDILKWHDFWDQFEASVHMATTNNALKMAYLVASLRGSALEAIEGLGTTNQNYGIAVETLKNRYGNKQFLVDAHYNALHQLECAKETPSECRRVLNSIEKNMRVLQSLGKDINGNGFRTILLNKFPEKVMFQLNIAIKRDSTVLAIREQLDNIITAMELSQAKSDVVSENRPTCSTDALHIRTQTRNKGRNWHNNKVKTGTSQEHASCRDKIQLKRNITTGADSNVKRTRRSCIFCDGGHYNDQCNTFKSMEERIKKIGNRCFKCFQEGHRSKQCQKRIICYHCTGPHNRALCRKKISDGNGKGPE
ncbi:uncharacterized protein LOC113233488 [Hyposmocoma kahamanoa]|uniref:uncharacterized protein LOC113233486 n=1 Tax=Hyposmocoma kahamanoa TaxID=1477025 RepID=UPI000E6D65EA|nr:uncharacterized protein LOC113233486 [Hyposmocoma kahamanoa]XP_026324400.1 uncharacterized protein LOC113233488 [Hyposmocoma kahamanoa]